MNTKEVATVQFCVKLLCYVLNIKKRPRRNCPVPGCHSMALKRLANHLRSVHNMDNAQRKEWLGKAKMVHS